MPHKLFVLIIGTVLLLGAATAWVISALPSTTAVAIVLMVLVGLRLITMRKTS